MNQHFNIVQQHSSRLAGGCRYLTINREILRFQRRASRGHATHTALSITLKCDLLHITRPLGGTIRPFQGHFSLICGKNVGGYMNLKVGAFVSSQLAESRVLRTGHAYELATEWHGRHLPIWVSSIQIFAAGVQNLCNYRAWKSACGRKVWTDSHFFWCFVSPFL